MAWKPQQFKRMAVATLAMLLISSSATAQVETETPRLNQPATVAALQQQPSLPTVPQFQGDATVRTEDANWADSQYENKFDASTLDDSGLTNNGTFVEGLSREAESLLSREGTESSIKAVLLIGALSLAPALLLMTTCYIRIIVVLTLLRQAFGAQQLPPTQVLTALSLFITLLVMAPVWQEVKSEAIDPYTASESSSESISWDEAWARGVQPVKKFMTQQISIAQNDNSIAVFYKYLPEEQRQSPPTSIEEVPITVLLPAFVISELKVAFLLGFQIYLPFLVLDLVVSTVTVSMGMMMLPPTMVSFPLKLILFVMVDGWNLVVGMLLQSLGPFT